MIEPTQVQIDAAITAFHNDREGDTEDDRMFRALTAAAQVDAQVDMTKLYPPIPDARDTMIAVLRDELQTIEAATIERCAQIADNYDGSEDDLGLQRSAIADTIRALKDKP